MAIVEKNIALTSIDESGNTVLYNPYTTVNMVDGAVSSINNITPDSNGNVTISTIGNATKATTADKLTNTRTITLGTAVNSTSTNFDGTSNITIPVTSLKESYLTWGGKNFSGSYGCIDSAMIPDLGANRLAFGKPNGITVEYSTDAGTTWLDYGLTDSQKVGLFGTGISATIGKATKDTITKDCMLRVTINSKSFGVYTVLNKFAIYVSTNGSSGCYCTIDASIASTPDTFTVFADKVPISGWSGWNIINTNGIITYGNTSSQSSQYGLLRFTFGCTSIGSSGYQGLTVIRIMGFGGVGWSTPSNMAKYGTIYSYDNNQNVTFPNNVTATQFNGNLKGSATTITDTLPISKGGTGKTNGADATNYLLNELSTGSDTPQDSDYYISQYSGGGTTNTTYHRRPISKLWEYIKSKISTVLGLTATQYGGNSATATKANSADSVDWTNVKNKPNTFAPSTHTQSASTITGLSTVATSGSYKDLTNKPTIPSAYTHPSTHPASMITGLSSVATSGSYNDLTNKPTIPNTDSFAKKEDVYLYVGEDTPTTLTENLIVLNPNETQDIVMPSITIGTVTTGSTSKVVNRGTYLNPILDFTLEKGEKGDSGEVAHASSYIASVTESNGQVTVTRGDGVTNSFSSGLNILGRNKEYAVGDIAYSPNLPSWAYLECITAGTTGDTEPTFTTGGNS